MEFNYQSGLGNEHLSEVENGIVPARQNNPQRHPKGLFAEQLNGTAFTNKADTNRRSWQYRKRPSIAHGPLDPTAFNTKFLTSGIHDNLTLATPEQLRWRDFKIEGGVSTLYESLFTVALCGDVKAGVGGAVHLFDASKKDKVIFANIDAEILLLPFEGKLVIETEFGLLDLRAGELAVIPRGVKHRINAANHARGYLFENYGRFLRLPYRGPIGANGMASARHFKVPTAWVDDSAGETEFIQKYYGSFWKTEYKETPFNVLGWYGNYYPYKYDLLDYNTMGSISFDHPDPSIFTVLTSPSAEDGTANVDFVVFPWRWLAMEDTFRPPYYHRNFMNEYMGLISGVYDAKPEGFVPGGSSLHNCMAAHGPDFESYNQAIQSNTKTPQKLDKTMAFMLETSSIWRPTRQSLDASWRDRDYLKTWNGL